MNLADAYARESGYSDAQAMLNKLNPDRKTNIGAAIEYSVQDAVIRALKAVDRKLSELEGGEP